MEPSVPTTRHRVPLVLAAAAFIAAGGYVHLREWLDTYRHVPSDAAGSFVVRIGFPVNAAISLLVAVALVATLFVARRFSHYVVAGAVSFQVASLGILVATRTGSVLGWTEPIWTPGADQTRAVEIGALVALAASAMIGLTARRVDAVRVRPGRALPQG